MSRNARSALFDLPLLSIDELIERTDAVTVDDVAELADELYAPERLSAACIGADEERFRDAVARSAKRSPPSLRHARSIRVVVAGAAGRMGATVCEAVEEADGLELSGRADPALDTALADVLGDADVVVDFTTPDTALGNAVECLEAGVSAVVGTTGFDLDELRAAAERSWTGGGTARLRRAELRDRRRADDGVRRSAIAEHMPEAEIVELHHDRKLDKPSGTAARTAELLATAGAQRPRADPLDPPAGPRRPPGGRLRRRRPDADDPPRLDRPRARSCRACVLACRRVGELPDPLTVGLEALL